MPDSATHRHVSILSGQAGHDRGNSFGSSLSSRYSPYSQRARNAGRRTQLSISLVSQGVASCNCRKFHIDKFFCDRHTIVAAASQFAARANSLNGPPMRLGHTSRCSSPVSHRITLARAFNQAAHLANMLTVQPVLLDRKRGVYRDNIATSFGCASRLRP
jgi:hypothetical protein